MAAALLLAGCGGGISDHDLDPGVASIGSATTAIKPGGPRGLIHTVGAGCDPTRWYTVLPLSTRNRVIRSITQIWNPVDSSGVYNNHPVIPDDIQNPHFWTIATQDRAALQPGASFYVLFAERSTALGELADAADAALGAIPADLAMPETAEHALPIDDAASAWAESADLAPVLEPALEAPPEAPEPPASELCPPEPPPEPSEPPPADSASGVAMEPLLAFEHVATPVNTLHNFTCLDEPFVVKSPLDRSAFLIITSASWPSDAVAGPVGAWYVEGNAIPWCIFLQASSRTMPIGARFQVEIWSPRDEI